MQELFTYILKASGLLIAFYITYHVLLRKETFFNSNRWFLLLGLVASALLPLFFIKKIIYIVRPKMVLAHLMALANHSKSNAVSISAPAVPTIDWSQIMMVSYGLVVVLLFIRGIINVYSVFKMIKNKTIHQESDYCLIDTQQAISPFSFFNYIVFNSSLYSPIELKNIIAHEKVHCQQKHSIDVVVVHLFTILFWINPILWMYKKAIIQNLEFIADHKAIQNIEDKKAYQKTLLKVVSHQNCLPITNQFYQSLIKKRIVMLNKNQSQRSNSWKYTVVIPVLIAFVFLFQIKVVAQKKTATTGLNEARAIAVGYTTDKNATDEEMKMDTQTLKAQLGIDYTFSNVKRNDQGEIIAIKIEYKTKEGKTGKIELDSEHPIEPIYFSAEEGKVGFSKNGFQDLQKENSKTVVTLSYNKGDKTTTVNTVTTTSAIANKGTTTFVTQNDNNDDVVVIRKGASTGIKVPGEPTFYLEAKPLIKIDGKIVEGDANIIINNLDSNEIESINVLKNDKAITYYGDEGKNGAIAIKSTSA